MFPFLYLLMHLPPFVLPNLFFGALARTAQDLECPKLAIWILTVCAVEWCRWKWVCPEPHGFELWLFLTGRQERSVFIHEARQLARSLRFHYVTIDAPIKTTPRCKRTDSYELIGTVQVSYQLYYYIYISVLLIILYLFWYMTCAVHAHEVPGGPVAHALATVARV